MSDLDKLIKAVEAGRGWDTISGSLAASVIGLDNIKQFVAAFNGSLDAAHALHKAVLPGWAFALSYWPGVGASAEVTETHEKNGGRWHGGKDLVVSAKSGTPARALLLADLYALRAMKERANG